MRRAQKPCVRPQGHAGQHQSRYTGCAVREVGREWERERREYWRSLLDLYKTSRGCAVCGFQNTRGGYFDLDHVEPTGQARTESLSYWVRRLNPEREDHVQRVIDAMKECQVLCVACHREKTGQDLKSV